MTFEVKDGALNEGQKSFSGLSFLVRDHEMQEVDVPEGCAVPFIHAMLGLRDLDVGVISLDGEPMTAYSASSLRRLMGYVPRTLVMPDQRERQYSQTELRRILLDEVSSSRRAVVIVDGLLNSEERDACQRMADDGAAVIVVREE